MSGLMRNVIDQVLKNMGEEERARSVEYVTDQMIAKMDNPERVELLLAIIDRVMSNLSPEERVAVGARVAERIGAGGGAQVPPVSRAAPPAVPAPTDVEKQTEEMG
jgi:hypothetical protein